MKKLIGIFGFVLVAGNLLAVDTPTPTFTPTPTWTPTAQTQQDNNLQREQVYAAGHITLDDGANSPVLTPVPGNGVWRAQYGKHSVLVMSSGTAKARIEWRLPNNYKPKMPLKIWSYGYFDVTNAAAVAVSLCVNVGALTFNKLTGTATEYRGVTINPQTANFGRLMDNKWSRFLWPTPAGLTQCALATSLNFQFVRTGTLGNLNIAYFEFEWDPSFMQNASLPDNWNGIDADIEAAKAKTDEKMPSLWTVLMRPEQHWELMNATFKEREEL